MIQSNPTTKNPDADTSTVDLHLKIVDAEVITELLQHSDGHDRNTYANCALRVGVLALRQASGLVDAEALRTEGARLLGQVDVLLTSQLSKTTNLITDFTKNYLDPSDGQLIQRLDQLVCNGGEMDKVLTQYLDGESSILSVELSKHIGDNSPLIRLLSPDSTEGILAAMNTSIESALLDHRSIILGEFSLDKSESALNHLLTQITDRNGALREDLRNDINALKMEFSLDNKDSSLSRLLKTINDANHAITREFSLDEKNSALSRMLRMIEETNICVQNALTLDDDQSSLSILRRELLDVIQEGNRKNTEFQKELRSSIDTLTGRKEESSRGTAHGLDFEANVGQLVAQASSRVCDAFEATGNTSGNISRCKIGDFVITLGPDSAAPNARIVIEAKEDKSYSVTQALKELDTARKNRNASAGVFVFSSKTAPVGIEPLSRHGDNVLVVWDSNDSMSDALLNGAIMVSRALAIRTHAKSTSAVDLAEMDKALNALTKSAEDLGEIVTWANTVYNSGSKIRDKAERIQQELQKQLDTLCEHLSGLRQA